MSNKVKTYTDSMKAKSIQKCIIRLYKKKLSDFGVCVLLLLFVYAIGFITHDWYGPACMSVLVGFYGVYLVHRIRRTTKLVEARKWSTVREVEVDTDGNSIIRVNNSLYTINGNVNCGTKIKVVKVDDDTMGVIRPAC